MCTAATYKSKDFYFGRTLDYEFSYGDQIVITPRNYSFHFRYIGDKKKHYAMIGMAHVAENYPLYYDAMNEKGVAIAGLNFVGNAVYSEVQSDVENIAQFEFIPWILSQCASLAEVRELLDRINIVNTPFSEQLPLAQLHWIISDENESITVESMSHGLHIYDNPVGVLTNNPPFPQQMFQLNNYMHLSPKQPENTFGENLALDAIYGGEQRVNIQKIDLEKVDIVAPEQSHALDSYQQIPLKDCSSGFDKDRHYIAVYRGDDGNSVRIRFTPDETLLNNMKAKARSKIQS